MSGMGKYLKNKAKPASSYTRSPIVVKTVSEKDWQECKRNLESALRQSQLLPTMSGGNSPIWSSFVCKD